MPDRVPVKLANESALGTYLFTWTSADGVRMGVMWGNGMGTPMAFRGEAARDVVRPERFGWKTPRNARDFKAFAQAFADEWEAGYDDDELEQLRSHATESLRADLTSAGVTADSPATLGPEGERLAAEERWT